MKKRIKQIFFKKFLYLFKNNFLNDPIKAYISRV